MSKIVITTSEGLRTRLDLPESCAGCLYSIEDAGCCHSAVEPASIGRTRCTWKKIARESYWFDRIRAATELHDFG